jgi:hypothetical protein
MQSNPAPVTKRWIEAMPAPLKPYWSNMRDFLQDGSFFIHKLERDGYSLNDLSLDLLYWYGSGYGPWSGYPMYERVAEFLLLEIPTVHLVNVALNSPLSDTHLEGVARHFCGKRFVRHEERELEALPVELIHLIFTHLKRENDQMKLNYFTRTFGEIKNLNE